jgi:hypothetical protein
MVGSKSLCVDGLAGIEAMCIAVDDMQGSQATGF